VLAVVVAAMLPGSIPPISAPVLWASAIALLAVATAGSYWVERHRSAATLTALFATQLALCGLALWGSGGTSGLVLLATISQSVLYLEIRFAALVVAIASAMAVAALSIVAPDAASLVQGLAGFGAAVAFVAAFSWMALKQHEVRADVERLAAELARANEQLRAHAAEVEELSAARERNRIAREIHDSVGHFLTATNVQLEAARAVIDGSPDRARVALGRAADLTRDALAEVRGSVALLRQTSPHAGSLHESLEALVERTRQGGLAAELSVGGEARTLSPPVELALYRAAQEALTNVQRHARATRVDVALRFSPEVVELSVEDDGVGAGEARPASGFGILGMTERIGAIGGRLEVGSGEGPGFRVRVEVPA
jgi:signal transduction histidine kinase